MSDMPLFDGSTFNRRHDHDRLSTQFRSVFSLMQDGEWRTLNGIAAATVGTLPGISARLRDCRKEKFGGHTVERRRRGEPKDGLFEYRLTVNQLAEQSQAACS